MKLTTITYTHNGKKKSVKAKVQKNFLQKGTGLMFKKNSPPLLFKFKKEKNLVITSLFCPPFKAIWLDKDMKATKVQTIKTWKFHISGYGKYLLEIPLTTKK